MTSVGWPSDYCTSHGVGWVTGWLECPIWPYLHGQSSELLARCLDSLHVTAWTSLQHSSWFQKETDQETREATKTFYDLALETVQPRSVLFVHKARPDPRAAETHSVSWWGKVAPVTSRLLNPMDNSQSSSYLNSATHKADAHRQWVNKPLLFTK